MRTFITPAARKGDQRASVGRAGNAGNSVRHMALTALNQATLHAVQCSRFLQSTLENSQ